MSTCQKKRDVSGHVIFLVQTLICRHSILVNLGVIVTPTAQLLSKPNKWNDCVKCLNIYFFFRQMLNFSLRCTMSQLVKVSDQLLPLALFMLIT